MKLKYKGKQVKIFHHLSLDERELAEKQIKEKAEGTTSFYMMIIISTIIVCAGLIINNQPVVIGGMMIAPLIWPLLALSTGIVHWHKRAIRKYLAILFVTLSVVLLISILMGLIYPFYELAEEIVLRTEPNIFDLIIALAAGLGGAFATVYSRRSPTIFGVAVAVALVPPLCTAGILLGDGRFNLVGGALLLFLTNLIAILLSSMFVFMMAKFSRPSTKEGTVKRNKTIIYAMISFIIIAIPLALLTINVIDVAETRNQTHELFGEMFIHEDMKNLKIVKTNGSYTMRADIYSANGINEASINKFSDYLSQRLNKDIYLDFTIIEVQEINTSSTDY